MKSPSSPTRRLLLRKRNPLVRINRQEDGSFQVEGMEVWYRYLRDPYHLMLAVPWWGFIAIVAVAYVVINALFALLYLLGGDCLADARPGSFEDAFFFSVHTFGSIGYGVISPKTTYANLIVTLEAIASLLTIAVVTGLTFARFSKPNARVIFSKFAVVTPYNGVPNLMFRVSNERRNRLVGLEVHVYLLRDEVTEEGNYYYRIHDLKLVRSRGPSLVLSWTGRHLIDEHSPLYGCTQQSLIDSHAQIVVAINGIDSTTAYTVHAQHSYGAYHVLFNHEFVNVLKRTPEGDRCFDPTDFHSVKPLTPPPSPTP